MQMPAAALKGYWVLEQLDKTAIETWKLGVGLCFVGTVAGFLGLAVLGDLPPESLLAKLYTPGELKAIAIMAGTLTGAFLTAGLAIARNVQTNTELSLGSEVAELEQALESTWVNVLLIFVLWSLTIVTFAFVNFQAVGFNTFSFTEVFNLGPIGVLTQYILQPIMALSNAIAFSVLVSITRYLARVARTAKIDLMRVDAYGCIAIPLVYLFASFCVLASVTIAAALLSPNEEVTRIFLQLLAMIAFLTLILAGLLSYPVWLFRRRVILAKSDQRRKIGKKIEELTVGQTERSSLLTELMYIDQLPDSPIGTYFQRIVVFGVLPPLTWVLAAAVENLLFS
jgi:hypothetical protein